MGRSYVYIAYVDHELAVGLASCMITKAVKR
jgi:hypothetical protein